MLFPPSKSFLLHHCRAVTKAQGPSVCWCVPAFAYYSSNDKVKPAHSHLSSPPPPTSLSLLVAKRTILPSIIETTVNAYSKLWGQWEPWVN